MTKRVAFKSMHAPAFLNEPIAYGSAFSRGITFRIHDTRMIFISGTASIDARGRTYRPGNFAAQLRKTFENLTALLRSENADWHDVAMTRCYLKDMKYYKEFNAGRTAFYREQGLDPFPASVGIQAELCRPDLLVEIEVMAVCRDKERKRRRRPPRA